MEMTHAEAIGIKTALEWLGNQPKAEKAKSYLFNAMQLRFQLAIDAYKPIWDAIGKVEQAMVERYEKEAGDDLKTLDSGNMTFGMRLDREFERERNALLDSPLELEIPKRRAFTLADFDSIFLAVPQSVLSRLGPLFDRGTEEDPDVIVADAAA